jgi:hypothetical protein
MPQELKKQPAQAFDKNAPQELTELQKWFASIITQEIHYDNLLPSTSPSGNAIEEEALNYIKPNTQLEAHQRIEVYHQQYWWRLLETLHTTYPFLLRLFGYTDFNRKIGIPYFFHNPSQSWSIEWVGKDLCPWLNRTYQEKDAPLIQKAAAIDWAFHAGFYAPELPFFELKDLDPVSLLNTPFQVQPHISLFSFDSQLFKFRDAFLKKDGDFWLNEAFPSLEKEQERYNFIVFRDSDLSMVWRSLSQAEWVLLSSLQSGSCITDACSVIEEDYPDEIPYAMKMIQKWFKEWTVRKWISLKD